jgi:pimeloyl-ACP methyl ester carboxylesterase
VSGDNVARARLTPLTYPDRFEYRRRSFGEQFMFRLLAAALVFMMPTLSSMAAPSANPTTATTYKTVNVNGLNVFYREAGPTNAPTILLLHGFPSSSRMFDTLMPLLADRYHLVAPDYPGFGNSEAPAPGKFNYTFDALTDVVGAFTTALHLDHYALYVQDYGGPVGYRLAVAHPERVTALIVQNAIAHEEGLGRLARHRTGFWADRAANEAKYRAFITSVDAAKQTHIGASPHAERYNPDLWMDEAAFLARPGEADIQSDLFYDYRNNLTAYPAWQTWLRERHPPTLIVWGRYDPAFDVAEVAALKHDVPNAEVHVLDAGHFALDESAGDIARLMRGFLARLPSATTKRAASHG